RPQYLAGRASGRGSSLPRSMAWNGARASIAASSSREAAGAKAAAPAKDVIGPDRISTDTAQTNDAFLATRTSFPAPNPPLSPDILPWHRKRFSVGFRPCPPIHLVGSPRRGQERTTPG